MSGALRTVAAEARSHRANLEQSARRKSAAVGAAILLLWTVVVTATGQVDRALENSAAALTMIFGSFVAGSTPQGGGAVAFPIFTKVLGVSAFDARTFSLSIQAIGMGSASAAIALTGRAIDKGALRLTIPAATSGFGAGTLLFSVVSPPASYLKVFFTFLVVAAGSATWLSRRRPLVEQLLAASLDSRRARLGILATAAAGGLASSIFGSGADVAVYLALTVVLGVRPSIGVATSVVTMAAVSVVGLGLSIATGDLIVSQVAAGATDVGGMWLAAIPVVVIGAPLGSWFASRVTPTLLARFIATLAVVELLSTAVFLDELRSNATLATFAVLGLVATLVGVWQIVGLRDRVAAAREPLMTGVRRLDIEVDSQRLQGALQGALS